MKKIAIRQKKISKVCSFILFIAVLLICICVYDVYSASRMSTLEASFVGGSEGTVKASFTLKVADTDQKRQKGLMYVKRLAKNDGMLFVYPKEDKLVFWMKNTFIPLDIVFLDKNYIVIGAISDMEPMGGRKDLQDFELPRYSINRKSSFAVELPAKSIRNFNIKVGDKLVLNKGAN